MTSINDHTKDKQQTKLPSDLYREHYDLIFRKEEPKKEEWKQLELDFNINMSD